MKPTTESGIFHFFQVSLLSALCGCLAGFAATVFLYTLQWATETRETYYWLIWLLPLAGWFIGWFYSRYGQNVTAGTHLILDEIHDPKNVIPLRMAPMILISTILTHLTGGSAGREGTAVQMGASLSDQLSRIFKVTSSQRRTLLMAGLGGGFGAAIGTPLAGAVFGLEVIRRQNPFPFLAIFECLISSFVAFFVARALHAPHSQFPKIDLVTFDFIVLGYLGIAGVLFGLTAQLFIRLTHLIEKVFDRFVAHPYLKPFLGGVLLIIFYKLEGSYRFTGLGIAEIQNAFAQPSDFTDPLLKIFFTALTIGSGFKGGEFIPLVFIGTTLGSALASTIGLPLPVFAAVGFASVFGGAAKTPLACTIMTAELFGWNVGLYALVGCGLSSLFCGRLGIYKNRQSE